MCQLKNSVVSLYLLSAGHNVMGSLDLENIINYSLNARNIIMVVHIRFDVKSQPLFFLMFEIIQCYQRTLFLILSIVCIIQYSIFSYIFCYNTVNFYFLMYKLSLIVYGSMYQSYQYKRKNNIVSFTWCLYVFVLNTKYFVLAFIYRKTF